MAAPGKLVAWSPDSKRIAFVSAQPGPEKSGPKDDPLVIARCLFKPADSEGDTRLNDNKRLVPRMGHAMGRLLPMPSSGIKTAMKRRTSSTALINAAMRRYPWIDRDRIGIGGISYGGMLCSWLITQTNLFKAAIQPPASATS